MITRILPPSEYQKLLGTELGILVESGRIPENTEVLVVEDGDRIVGCWSLMRYYHCEGIWIHPDYRLKPSVTRRLWTGMQDLAAMKGINVLLTGCLQRKIQRLLERAGAVQIPGLTYAIPVGGPTWQQPSHTSSVE